MVEQDDYRPQPLPFAKREQDRESGFSVDRRHDLETCAAKGGA